VATKIPKKRWQPAISADGTAERESGEGGRDHRPGGSVALGSRHPDDRTELMPKTIANSRVDRLMHPTPT
jgi:hypothetical protein